MKRALPLLLLALLAGCGSKEPKEHLPTTVPVPTTSVPYKAIEPGGCNPPAGEGSMGVCVPKSTSKQPQALPPVKGVTVFPDTSEWTSSCHVYSAVIFRVYEAGTEAKDSKASCFAREAKAKGFWHATYGFQRPGHGGCVYQADRTVAITREVGGAEAVIDDAEVPLRASEIRCFLARVSHDGFKALEYTCPGCSDAQIGPVWIAAYPYRPPGHWVAHQFSSEFKCRGIYGDCSVDEGILAIGRKPPAQRSAHLHALQRRAIVERAAIVRLKARYYADKREIHRLLREGVR